MSQLPSTNETHSPYKFISKARLPTAHGQFDIHVFENAEGQEHVMLTCGLPTDNTDDVANKEKLPPLVRIHSECLTGDAFSSLKCDCGPQLNATMQAIQQEGCGAILYLRQEGRGIGLTNKIRAYALQDQGHDTLDANLLLGLPADARTYEMCKPMLDHVGISKLRLMTNNPDKLSYLEDLGFEVVERIPLVVGLNPFNVDYLATKRERMGHHLNNDISSLVFKPISEQ
ncbi:GTP cyclohydrolase II [Psychrobacter sp. YP14]|uniref:GTP cyclohydrolase-2 n=3 Tax=Psychrobacter TaxID=497 RepID=A0A844LYD1_9GAMM|nr:MULTISPECIES: GTP cyclohydrolase II [Psychrobacter]AWT48442.1 GTP cyclohydrolase II [Psychrobacter sp. YP14]MUG31420.1 GTP cyclohydrolase II [Psychrobacter sanguinis]UNK05746.1 GTP cyclohydrolase II [Psychrobacter sp. PraFG1]